MNTNLRKMALGFFGTGLLMLGCSIFNQVPPTPTALPPTDTSVPTKVSTSTSIPTHTLAPTKTPVPPTSTYTPMPTPVPAHLREAVTYENVEITVLDVYRHDRIVPGGAYYYTPKPGYMIIDLVVKIKNLGGTPPIITWGDLYVLESDGERSYTEFAGFLRAGNNERVDPLSIQYDTVSPNTKLEFSSSIYLRVIFIIKLKPEQVIRFGIKDSPLIQFTVYK